MAEILSLTQLETVGEEKQGLDKHGPEKSVVEADLVNVLEKSTVKNAAMEENHIGDSTSVDKNEETKDGNDIVVESTKNAHNIENNVEDASLERDDSVENDGCVETPVEADTVDPTMPGDTVEPNPSDEGAEILLDEATPLEEQTASAESNIQNEHDGSVSATLEDEEPSKSVDLELAIESEKSEESTATEVVGSIPVEQSKSSDLDLASESEESVSTEAMTPESEVSKQQADKEENGDHKKEAEVLNNSSLANSTSNEVENDNEKCQETAKPDNDRVVDEGVNEIPEDKRVDTKANNVIVIDDNEDEEVLEEDQTISIDISDEHQNEFNEVTVDENMETENAENAECPVINKNNDSHVESEKSPEKTVDGDQVSEIIDNNASKTMGEGDGGGDKVIESLASNAQSNVVVIDDDDLDEATGDKGILAPELSETEKSQKSNPTSKNSSDMESSSRSMKTSSHKSAEAKRKDAKDSKMKYISRSLWISGLSPATKAVDLKELFAQHGRVIGAKVVTRAKAPGSLCFGFVTMSSIEESSTCIEKLHKTLLQEKTIKVNKAKTDPTPTKFKAEEKNLSRHQTSRSNTSRSTDRSSHRSHERRKDRDRKSNEKKREKGDGKTTSLKPSTSEDSSKEGKSTKAIGMSISASKESDESKDVMGIDDQTKKEDESTKTSKKDEKESEENKKDRIEQEGKLKVERELEEEGELENDTQEKKLEWARLEKERLERRAERRAREEKEKREREKLKWERLERERLERREREEREKKERVERERRESELTEIRKREQLEWKQREKERLERRERRRLEDERVEREVKEKQLMEKEKEREHVEKEQRRVVMVDRGLGIKRPVARDDDQREHHPDHKRQLNASANTRKDFFSLTGKQNDPPSAQFRNEQSSQSDHRDDNNSYKTSNRGKGNVHESRQSRENTRSTTTRHDTHSNTREYGTGSDGLAYQQTSGIRRVVSRDIKGDSYRDRSPHRANDLGSNYRGDFNRNQNISGAPKTLSDILGRAGLTGVLGNRTDKTSWASDVSRSHSGDQFYSNGNNGSQDSNRGMDHIHDASNTHDYQEQQHNTRMDSRNQSGDHFHTSRNNPDFNRGGDRSRTAPMVPDYREQKQHERPESRADYQRNQLGNEHHGEITNRYPYQDSRQVDYKNNLTNNHDGQCGPLMDARGMPNTEAISNSNITNGRNFNGNNRQNNQLNNQPLARDIRFPNVSQPLGLPGPGLQNFDQQNIQVNRNGRLEYTQMTPGQTNMGMNRRF